MDRGLIIIVVAGMILLGVIAFSENKAKTKDPLAQRIEAVKQATWDMPDALREKLLMEVIKGATNLSTDVVLEK